MPCKEPVSISRKMPILYRLCTANVSFLTRSCPDPQVSLSSSAIIWVRSNAILSQWPLIRRSVLALRRHHVFLLLQQAQVGFVCALCAGNGRSLNYRSNRQRYHPSASRHPGRATSKKPTCAAEFPPRLTGATGAGLAVMMAATAVKRPRGGESIKSKAAEPQVAGSG